MTDLKRYRVEFTLVRTGIVHVYAASKEEAETMVEETDFNETKAKVRYHDESLEINRTVLADEWYPTI